MANTYSWVISQLDCCPEQDNYKHVVLMVHWRRQATDGTHTAAIYGQQTIQLVPDAPFTSFSDLTESDVVGWLENALGDELLAAQIEALDKQIADQINPPIIELPLPWIEAANYLNRKGG